MCKMCGKVDRAENLKRFHFKEDHGAVANEYLRYLKVGEEPETNVELFKQALATIGSFTPNP